MCDIKIPSFSMFTQHVGWVVVNSLTSRMVQVNAQVKHKYTQSKKLQPIQVTNIPYYSIVSSYTLL